MGRSPLMQAESPLLGRRGNGRASACLPSSSAGSCTLLPWSFWVKRWSFPRAVSPLPRYCLGMARPRPGRRLPAWARKRFFCMITLLWSILTRCDLRLAPRIASRKPSPLWSCLGRPPREDLLPPGWRQGSTQDSPRIAHRWSCAGAASLCRCGPPLGAT